MKDRRRRYASIGHEYLTCIAECKWPVPPEIESDPQFKVTAISGQESEIIWQQAIQQSTI